MKRRIALVLGVMALAVMAPGAAQAQMQEPHFQGDAGPLSLSIPPAAFDMQLYAQAGCARIASSGSMPIETKAIDLFHAWPEECELYGYESSVKMNYCGLTLSVENVGPPYQGAAAIHCFKAGEAIELSDVYGLCTTKIHPSAGVPGSVDYENVGSGASASFIADVHMTKINYTVIANSIFCPIPKGTYSNGSLSTVLSVHSGYLKWGVSLKGEKV